MRIEERNICFIGGAPKCGTSSAFVTLSRIEEICPSSPKETFYFIDDGNPLINDSLNIHLNGITGFEIFFNSNCNHKLLEATSHLLFQKDIIPEIEKINCKIVFLLRAPEKRIESSFNYTKNNLGRIKKGLEFDHYVDLLLEKNEAELERWIKNPKSLYVLRRELEHSTYIKYLEPWMKVLGNRIKVMFYEEMISDPHTFYKELCSFFELPFNYEYLEMEKKNVTQAFKNPAIHYALSSLRDRGFVRHPFFQPMKALYKKIQQRPVEKKYDDLPLRRLKNYFIPFNVELSNYLNRQLPW